MTAGPRPVYFTDENTLGLGKLLVRSGRDDVRYPVMRVCQRSRWARPMSSG
jgi:hypothetical protein